MINKITEKLLSLEKAYILVHTSPDGDALGSSLALGEFLRSLGKIADVVLEKPIHSNYSFLEGEVLLPEQATDSRTVIVLDCGDLPRVGETMPVYENALETVVIDHHATNPGYGDLCLVKGGMSSTGEIVFDIIRNTGKEYNSRVAFLLYTAIISDTGGLRYSSTTPETLRVVAELVEKGIDIAYINRMLFENNPLRVIKLKSLVYSTLEIKCNGKAAMVKLTEEMLEKTGADEGDSEGFVNIPRSVEGVEVGVFFKERDGEVRVSLRSNAYADVSLVAKQLGGGGHIHAGGCTVKGTMEDAVKTVFEKIEGIL